MRSNKGIKLRLEKIITCSYEICLDDTSLHKWLDTLKSGWCKETKRMCKLPNGFFDDSMGYMKYLFFFGCSEALVGCDKRSGNPKWIIKKYPIKVKTHSYGRVSCLH